MDAYAGRNANRSEVFYWLVPILLDIQVWDSFRLYTKDPKGWPAQ
jgi:hypothetical protein